MDSDRRARDRDRDAAIRLVESAWADGQIIELDRDKRVEELHRAQMTREIAILVHDLAPAPVPDLPVEASTGSVPDSRRSRRAVRIPKPLLLVVAVVIVVTLLSNAGTGDDEGESPTPVPAQEAVDEELDLFTARGYDALVADLEAETGRSEVFSAMLHPSYASVRVPVDGTSRQQQGYEWDGELEPVGARDTSSDRRVDLREVDHALMARLVRRMRSRVEDPTAWYAILHAPAGTDGSLVQAYASNDVGETAYVVADETGKVLYADALDAAASR
ncbi:hypothetical protein [Nocardioides dongkuii]|uniref:hypothetical protein n=1 Tax=Nocardioides dongkuii TaxID=2760089 RepID=UPI0015F99B98|nr:hypothetical protein [Nocardioides dongkuii]